MKKTTIPIKFGIFSGVFLIVYFLILGSLEVINSYFFSIVNALICAVGIYMAISDRKRYKQDVSHKECFNTGVTTGIYASILFTVFFAIFSAQQDGGPVKDLIEEMGYPNLNLWILVIIVFVLGVITAYVVTFLVLKIFKKSLQLQS